MASVTSAINVNVDTEIKRKATKILKELGLNMSTFINMALTQVVKKEGIPFEVVNSKPNRELIKALKEAENIVNGKVQAKGYHNIDELFEDLDSDN